MISLDKHGGQEISKCDLKNKLRFDADHSGEIDHEETIGIIECILDGKVTPETFHCIVISIINMQTWNLSKNLHNFRAKEFYTLKTRKSRLFLPAINSKNASLSVIWPPFG